MSGLAMFQKTPNSNEKSPKTGKRKAEEISSSLVDNLVCPITHELPFDPVTAMDGRTYERSAIMQHFETCKKQKRAIKSPMTNESMADTLLPAPQQKSHIQDLIDKELIAGDAVKIWNEKLAVEKKKEDLLRKAEGGDPDSMFRVGRNYHLGKSGFPRDVKLACEWLEKGAKAGEPHSMYLHGYLLLRGHGTSLNQTKGMMYIGIAAGMGAKTAQLALGKFFAKGTRDISPDPNLAVHWLEKSVSPEPGPCGWTLPPSSEEEAQQILATQRALLSNDGSNNET